MKFCSQCGKQLKDEARFCSACGAGVPENTVVPGLTDNQKQDFANSAGAGMDAGLNNPFNQSFADGADQSTIPLPDDINQQIVEQGQTGFSPANENQEIAASAIPEPIDTHRLGKKKKIIIASTLALLLAVGGFLGWQNFGTEARSQDKLDLAVKYLSDNNYEKAILAFNDAIEIDPKKVDAYQGLARTYTLQGKYDEAESTYEKGLTAVTQDNKPALQICMAGMYFDRGDLSESKKAFQDLINNDSNCMEAYYGLAMVYQQEGDNDKAKEILRQAIDKNPDQYQAYNQLALFLQQNGEEDEAFNYLTKSLSLESNQQEAYSILSDLCQNNYSEIRNKASNLTNQKVAAMLEFYSYYLGNKYEQAISCYQQKLKSDHKNIKAQILTATAMIKHSDKTGAKTLLAELDEKAFNDALLTDLAYYYQAAGDIDQAREYAIKALQMNDTNLQAIALLQNLSSNNAEVKLFSTRALLLNWKALELLIEEMQAMALFIPGERHNDNDIFKKISDSSNVTINVNQIDNQQFPLMKLYVSVLDSNNESIDNLPLNYFIIREKLLNADKYTTQKVKSVEQLEQKSALSIDLVMDTSASMSENSKLENAKQAASNFIDIVNGSDELGIIEFNSYVRTKTDFTKNTSDLLDAISQLYTSGQTALYDAMYTALVQTSQKEGAKCVIVFTDGQSNKDTKSKQDVIDLAKKTGIPIYTIGIGSDVHEDVLNDIAVETGGYYVSTPTAADLESIYKNIFKVQKKQYRVIYKSTNTVQNKNWRNVQLGVYGNNYAGMSAKEYTTEIVKPKLGSLDMGQVNKIIKNNAGKGDYSIVIKDLSNGQQYKTGKYTQRMPASALINIPITLAIADMLKDGSISLDTQIPFHYTIGGRIKLKQENDGQLYSIGELLKTMLNYSDNNCTNTLLEYIGIDKVNNIAQSYGCNNTQLQHPLLDQETSTENWTTCEDVEKMLEMLYSDALPIGSAYMNENFKIIDQTKKMGILKYLPENIFALHHNAMTSTKYNETAYIGNGSKKYIITVLSCNGKEQELEETTALISKYVYDQMLK